MKIGTYITEVTERLCPQCGDMLFLDHETNIIFCDGCNYVEE